MNREICGQCGQSLDPDWVDERIPKLESMLREAIRERDSLRQHLHDEHQRHVGTMDERDAALADLAAARADAERYRWLRDTRRIALGPIVGQRPAMGESGCRYVIAHGSIARVAHDIETLDAAIDAALGERHE